MELMSHIQLAREQDFITAETESVISKEADRTLKLIHGYINYLKRSKRGNNEPGAKRVAEVATEYSDFTDEVYSDAS